MVFTQRAYFGPVPGVGRMSDSKCLSKCVAEAIATFALTFIGAGTIWLHGDNIVAVAAAHGLILAVMVSATMNVSGAHINPAVTLALMSTKRITPKLAGYYILSQLFGAALAGGVLSMVGAAGAGTPAPQMMDGNLFDTQTVILVEIVLTFLLMIAIMGTAVDNRAPAGIAGFGIGLTVMADILMGGGITGAAMNPARWMGTWLFSDMENSIDLVIYWLGPIIGAVLAATVWDKFIADSGESDE